MALSFGQRYKVSEVFVPGGIPTHTYYPRDSYALEKSLRSASQNLCKLVVVTGSTKSGKTVLVNSIYPKDDVVWIDGGLVKTEVEFWKEVASRLEVVIEVVESSASDRMTGGKGSLATKGCDLFSWLPLEAQGTVEHASKKSKSKTTKRQISDKSGATKALREFKTPIVIDDFHYLDRPLQGTIVRALKSIIQDGCPVVFIAIPNRRYDVVKVEREMTGRLLPLDIPVWSPDELENIPKVGFPLLNVQVEQRVIVEFTKQAIGSPHLMQEFCRELCDMNAIEQTSTSSKSITYGSGYDSLFTRVADATGRTMFDKLKRGPRQRQDRLPRKLKDGTTTDIYGLVLAALAYMKPGLESIEYTVLRQAIRDVSEDEVPQAGQISNVLEHMTKISANDESSTPVIQWDSDEKVLHVTDPFFAYFLRWGVPGKRKSA